MLVKFCFPWQQCIVTIQLPSHIKKGYLCFNFCCGKSLVTLPGNIVLHQIALNSNENVRFSYYAVNLCFSYSLLVLYDLDYGKGPQTSNKGGLTSNKGGLRQQSQMNA